MSAFVDLEQVLQFAHAKTCQVETLAARCLSSIGGCAPRQASICRRRRSAAAAGCGRGRAPGEGRYSAPAARQNLRSQVPQQIAEPCLCLPDLRPRLARKFGNTVLISILEQRCTKPPLLLCLKATQAVVALRRAAAAPVVLRMLLAHCGGRGLGTRLPSSEWWVGGPAGSALFPQEMGWTGRVTAGSRRSHCRTFAHAAERDGGDSA